MVASQARSIIFEGIRKKYDYLYDCIDMGVSNLRTKIIIHLAHKPIEKEEDRYINEDIWVEEIDTEAIIATFQDDGYEVSYISRAIGPVIMISWINNELEESE